MKARPIGITILAFLFALNVAVYVVFAALAVFNHPALVAVLHALSLSGAGPETIHSSMGRLQPLYYSAMAILTCAMAVGFWKVQNWARIVMLTLITLSMALMMTELRPLLAAPTGWRYHSHTSANYAFGVLVMVSASSPGARRFPARGGSSLRAAQLAKNPVLITLKNAGTEDLEPQTAKIPHCGRPMRLSRSM